MFNLGELIDRKSESDSTREEEMLELMEVRKGQFIFNKSGGVEVNMESEAARLEMFKALKKFRDFDVK